MPLRWPIVVLLTVAPIGLVVALVVAARHHTSSQPAQPVVATQTAHSPGSGSAPRSKTLTATGYASLTAFVRVGMRFPASSTSAQQLRRGCSSLPSSADRVAADVRLTCFRVADERQTIRDIRGCGTKTGSDALDCLDTSLGQLSREMRGTLRSNNDILATLQRGRCRALLAGEGSAADRRLIVATNQLTSLLGTAGDPQALRD